MSGAEQQFEQLWSAHASAVLRYAARRVPASEVDDVVAETFVVAWRRIDAVPEPALPWLLGVARGVAANATRSANRRTALHLRLAGAGQASEEAEVLPGPEAGSEVMVAALDRLSPVDRELLMLIAWDGLTPGEAAEALGCSRATLAVRLHRARARLRTHLATGGVAAPAPATSIQSNSIDRVAVRRPGTTRGEDSR
jgi:RNA polymerase sigma-70 factor (ECF subfamily)